MKDKTNLLNYSQWSCGDYTNNIQLFYKSSYLDYILSDEWSSNGEYSVKLINKDINFNRWFRFYVPYSIVGNKLTAKIKVLNPKIRVQVSIVQYTGDEIVNSVHTTSYPSNNMQNIILDTITVDGLSHVRINVNLNNGEVGDFVYIDDVNICER